MNYIKMRHINIWHVKKRSFLLFHLLINDCWSLLINNSSGGEAFTSSLGLLTLNLHYIIKANKYRYKIKSLCVLFLWLKWQEWKAIWWKQIKEQMVRYHRIKGSKTAPPKGKALHCYIFRVHCFYNRMILANCSGHQWGLIKFPHFHKHDITSTF